MFAYDGGGSDRLCVEDVFSAYTYTGTGSALGIVNGIDLSNRGGLVWTKRRDSAGFSNGFIDTARGVLNTIYSDATNAQASTANSVTAFNSNGYSLGASSTWNASGGTYVGWSFRKAPKFFDIVTYTGTGANRTISHNLGSVPGMIIIKKTSGVGDWYTYHRSTGNTQYLQLNTTISAAVGATAWNNTSPTATEFTVGTNTDVNQSGQTYVAYLFAHDTSSDGIIQCGTFTTDGSGNAIISGLGWEPQYILWKRSDSTGNWIISDTARGWNLGASDADLLANSTTAEAIASRGNPTATGASIVTGSASATMVYMAIRKGLMRAPSDATKVFAINSRTGTSGTASISGATITTGVDLEFVRSTSTGTAPTWTNRLTGTNSQLASSSTNAETTLTDVVTSFNMDGVTFGANGVCNTNPRVYINYLTKQAKGFFDIVAYTGTGSAHTEAHNLGVVPELMIVKCRSAANDWAMYYGDNTDYLLMNSTAATVDDATYWNDTSPTSSVFTIGTNSDVNTNTATYVAYLFATVSGVSKIGTYTGTGTTNQINCGFTAGARFVMIKRIDSTGDWYFWDTTRGIVSGNDPYLLMNSNVGGETTGTDYIDPYSPGFEISSSAPAAINASGGSFLYFAIA